MKLAFIPSAPLLLPALGGGPDDLRSACQHAISCLDGDVVVIGSGRPTGWCSGTVDATPYGLRGEPAAHPLPLALAVGSALLGERPHRLLAVDGRPVELPAGADLLVVGDGTAKRTEKAPGHFDPRAEAYDEAVVAGLRAGRLPDLDVALGRELLVGGLDAWCTVAASVPGRFTADVRYAGAPYGVGYVVATWIGS
ncbi:MAG: hypothetical protein ABR549_20500 [Mycobacteriales bacterium]